MFDDSDIAKKYGTICDVSTDNYPDLFPKKKKKKMMKKKKTTPTVPKYASDDRHCLVFHYNYILYFYNLYTRPHGLFNLYPCILRQICMKYFEGMCTDIECQLLHTNKTYAWLTLEPGQGDKPYRSLPVLVNEHLELQFTSSRASCLNFREDER